MGNLTVCDTKQLYDTEFEAQVAVAHLSSPNEEMKYYRCGKHYHLTHIDRTKRRGAGKHHSRCPHCKKIFKKVAYTKHRLSCEPVTKETI